MNGGKIGACSRCGTVKRVYEAGQVEVVRSGGSGTRASRWLCLACYREAIQPKAQTEG